MHLLRVATVLVVSCMLMVPGRAVAQMWVPPPAPPPMFNNYAPSPYGLPPPNMMLGQRCASAAGVCVMGAPGPAGTPCYCQTPYGAAPGQIVP